MATYTVNTDGVSGDYASLEAACNGIGTLTENSTIEIDSDAGNDTTACNIDITLDGNTLDITNVGSSPYQLQVSSQWGSALIITSACTITGIEVVNTDANGTGEQTGITNNATSAVLKNFAVHDCRFENIRDNGTNNIYVNGFMWGGSGESFRKHGNGGAVYIYYLTIGSAGTYGIFGGDFRTVYAKNVYVGGSGTADLYEDTNGDIQLTTTYTADGSLSTPTAAYDTASGAYLTDVTPDALGDLDIANALSGLIGNGADLSGDGTYAVSDDYYGTARGETVDVGAHEYVAAGGTTYNETCTDGVSFADTSANTAVLVATAADGISAADSPGGLMAMQVSATSGITAADVVSAIMTLAGSATSGITLSDATSAAMTIVSEVTDDILVTDTASCTLTIGGLVVDGISLADAVTAALVIVVTTQDGITLSDVVVDDRSIPNGPLTLTITAGTATATITDSRATVTVSDARGQLTTTGAQGSATITAADPDATITEG